MAMLQMRHTSPEPVSVTHLDIPFVRLMLFCFKAVFAAIPALIVLGAVLYGVGELLQSYFPELRQFELVIRIPKP